MSRPHKPAKTDYSVVHRRILMTKGPAKAYLCMECEKQAHDWSYDGKDPEEMRSTNGNGYAVVYSRKIERYQPLCRKCHNGFDAERRRNEAEKRRLGLIT